MARKYLKRLARPEGFEPPTLRSDVVSVPNEDKRVSKTYYESLPIPTLNASPFPPISPAWVATAEAETASVLIVFPVVIHFQNVSNVEQNFVPVSYTKFAWI